MERRPNFIFLIETLCLSLKIEEIKNILHYDGFFAVDCHGRSGGLALLWKGVDAIHLLGSSPRYIDAEVRIFGLDPWRLTGFYGEPDRNRRNLSWDVLKYLASCNTLPWVCIGDYNDIMGLSEKVGRLGQPNHLIQGFREAVGHAGLVDIKCDGYKFTWDNGRQGRDHVEAKLDRCMINASWKQLFSHATASVLDISSSDHLPILLTFRIYVRRGRVQLFRFENAWVKEPECVALVEDCWHDLQTVNLIPKLASCSRALDRWGKIYKSKFKDSIDSCRQEIARLRGKRGTEDRRKFLEAKARFGELLQQREIFWKQRAKVEWLREGNRNTKYFHARATERKKKNSFEQLRNKEGVWCNWENGLQGVISDYFSELYTSQASDSSLILNYLPRAVSDEDNMELLRGFTREEVREAVFDMGAEKSPGDDGLNPGFFQRFWNIIGSDVADFCISCIASGRIPDEVNTTLLVLIPKKQTPEQMTDLRPIALCQVLYKIMAKMVANRMKHLLPKLISPYQSAFVAGRQIQDNSIIAYEVLHHMRGKRQGRAGEAALKIDISKAYDRLEWGFLRDVMIKMGFSVAWVQIIMSCISTVSYKIYQQGHLIGPVIPSRGLRQGDPLSPYLFILCAEVLSRYILSRVAAKEIHGCCVRRGAPEISHLFFADDSVLFFKATENEAVRIRDMLQTYEMASGQAVNLAKSLIYFSPNTPVEFREKICQTFNVRENENLGNYLGLPTSIGRNKKEILSFVKDKVWKRIHSWKNRMLSKAGKEVLIKTVLQAIPNYVMSLFLLPIGTCEELEKIFADYWWGKNEHGNPNLHWMSWERLCKHKSRGGMQFKRVHEFNIAMLGRIGWRLIQNPQSLMAQVLKARYFPNRSFMEAELGVYPSYTWRGILAGRQILRKGLCWRIGSGRNISIWSDPWIQDVDNMRVTTEFSPEKRVFMVEDLLQDGRWHKELIEESFNERDAKYILSIPVSRSATDSWFWLLDRNGIYSVKTAYRSLIQEIPSRVEQSASLMWKRLWRLHLPPQVKNFIWRAGNNILPTRSALHQKRVSVPLTCPLCNFYDESSLHLLVQCDFASQVWSFSNSGWFRPQCSSFLDWLVAVMRLFNDMDVCMILVVCWAIWNSRNSVIWANKFKTPAATWFAAKRTLGDWQNAQEKREQGARIARPRIWKPPDLGWIKVNIDAATNVDDAFTGVAFVARDEHGRFVAARNSRIVGLFSPRVAEAIAFKEALSWIQAEGWTHVCCEGDSLDVVHAIESAFLLDLTSFGAVINDIKTLVRSWRGNCGVAAVPRTANSAAHCLAQATRNPVSVGAWRGVPPNFLNVVLLADLN